MNDEELIDEEISTETDTLEDLNGEENNDVEDTEELVDEILDTTSELEEINEEETSDNNKLENSEEILDETSKEDDTLEDFKKDETSNDMADDFVEKEKKIKKEYIIIPVLYLIVIILSVFFVLGLLNKKDEIINQNEQNISKDKDVELSHDDNESNKEDTNDENTPDETDVEENDQDQSIDSGLLDYIR